jgi:hypothetical protein
MGNVDFIPYASLKGVNFMNNLKVKFNGHITICHKCAN